ncbi:serine hydrolase [candidate division KSB1 bacterium]|nr:serine hydrolase [candidate division KSB1 bacterium]
MKILFVLFWIMTSAVYAGETSLPSNYEVDTDLSNRLQQIVTELELNGDFDAGEDGLEQISLAVIDLTGDEPQFGGVNYDNFIYPASVYKMYVAAEILHQVSNGERALTDVYIARFPNVVDGKKEITWDPRPLLQDGDTVTVNYLLDLMITRSDNSAANCLIDLANRENINAMLHSHNWDGSEVTRKFLKRQFEDAGYENIRGTETCALHAADFMYRVYTNQLINPWVSMQMKALLGRQLDKSKLASGLPPNVMFYHKTGWFDCWTHDVGIVDDGHVHYVIACFLPLNENEALGKHKQLSKMVYELIRDRH